MDMAQVFIFDAGWIFFAAWGMVLAAVSVIAFGRDILPIVTASKRRRTRTRSLMVARALRCTSSRLLTPSLSLQPHSLPSPRLPKLAPRLLKFHLHNLHDSQEYASAPALPQALPLGLRGGRFLHFSEQRRLGAAAAGDPARGGRSEHRRHSAKLLHFALQMLEVAAVRGIFLFLTRWIVIGISRDIEFDLRNDLFAHLESLSYSYYQRMRTGDIMARVTNDLNAVRMLLGPAIMYSANTLVFTAAALSFMVRISPRLTFYAFLPLPVVSIVIQYFGRRIHERFERIQAMFSDISARAQENFSGARVIRAYVQEEAEIASFESANQEYIARSLKLVRLMGMLWPTLELMLGLAVVLVLWIGGREVLAGPHGRLAASPPSTST